MSKRWCYFLVLFFGLVFTSQATEVSLKRQSFACQNFSIIQRVIKYFSHGPSYVLVLDRSSDYQQLLVKKDSLERKLKSVDILDRYGFDLVIAQQGKDFLLINNFCYNEDDAESNRKTLRFFFNLPVELVVLNKHEFGRSPASKESPLFLVTSTP